MLRPLLAPVLAAALALSPVAAAPARADGEDLAKVLAGLATLYIIGRAVNQHRQEVGRGTHQPGWSLPGLGVPGLGGSGLGGSGSGGSGSGGPGWGGSDWSGSGWGSGGHGGQSGWSAKPALPASCLRTHYAQGAVVRGYDAPCLERSLPQSAGLPASCRARIDTWEGPFEVYRSGCLAQVGFRVAAAG